MEACVGEMVYELASGEGNLLMPLTAPTHHRQFDSVWNPSLSATYLFRLFLLDKVSPGGIVVHSREVFHPRSLAGASLIK